jgi:hypothetical protein
MREDAELAGMFAAWCGMAAGPAKDVLFHKMMELAVKHPAIAEKLFQSGSFAAKEFAKRLAAAAAARAAAAAGRAATYAGTEAFLIRFYANMAVMPKIPQPAVIGAGLIGAAILAAGCSENVDPKAFAAYEAYVADYVTRMVIAKQYHPQNNAFPSPKEFNEWYAENYK